MKRKMVFGAVVLVLFVLQAQSVFAQSNNMLFFRVDDAHLWTNGNRERITDRVLGASMSAEPGSMMIMVSFNDGSYLTYQFTSSSQRTGGGWILGNGSRSTSLGGNFSGNYRGEIAPFIVNEYRVPNAYTIDIIGEQGHRLHLSVQGL